MGGKSVYYGVNIGVLLLGWIGDEFYWMVVVGVLFLFDGIVMLRVCGERGGVNFGL